MHLFYAVEAESRHRSIERRTSDISLLAFGPSEVAIAWPGVRQETLFVHGSLRRAD